MALLCMKIDLKILIKFLWSHDHSDVRQITYFEPERAFCGNI